MLKVPRKLVSARITILRFAFHRPVDHFLELGRNRRINFARRDRIIQKPEAYQRRMALGDVKLLV